MGRCVRTAVLCSGLLALPSAAAGGQWQLVVGAGTDHVQRGVSHNAGDPALLAGAAYRFGPGTYVAVSGATVSNARTSVRGAAGRYQLDLVAGVGRSWDSGWDLDLAVSRYEYPRADSPVDYGYTELSLSAGFADRLRATAAWSPDSTTYTRRGLARDRAAWSWELFGEQPLPGRFSALAGLGYHDLRGPAGGGYAYFSTGLAARFAATDVELQYIDTWRGERLYGRTLAGPRVVLSVMTGF